MLNALAVGAGGFIGAISRYILATFINRYNDSNFPISTLIINVLGSFLIGFLTHMLITIFPTNKRMQLFLTTGILGGFTTFSTFSLETLSLYQNGNGLLATANIVLSIAFCLAGVFVGKLLATYYFVQG